MMIILATLAILWIVTVLGIATIQKNGDHSWYGYHPIEVEHLTDKYHPRVDDVLGGCVSKSLCIITYELKCPIIAQYMPL